jgi:hypothetical protein
MEHGGSTLTNGVSNGRAKSGAKLSVAGGGADEGQ